MLELPIDDNHLPLLTCLWMTHLKQFLWVDGSMEILATSNWLRENHTGGVNSLPAILEIHTPSDLLDEHRGQTLRTKKAIHEILNKWILFDWKCKYESINTQDKSTHCCYRIFLCTQRKLISTIFSMDSWTRMSAGTAVISATSLLLDEVRTPTCHCTKKSGGVRAHIKNSFE